MDRYEGIANQIAARGWAVSEQFLPEDAIAALAEEAAWLWAQGDFKAAGVGRSADYQVRADIRSDEILWLDEQRATPAQARYFSEINCLREALNRELFIGLVGIEAHYARYPVGAYYRKHLDRFTTSSDRLISCTLYLNSDWRIEDGGALRIYAHEQAEPVDIYPCAGTFAVFRSDTIYHEVLPARRVRLSITGWLKRRPL